MMERIAFIALAALVLGSALGVVTARNIFHSLLFLAFSFLGVAGTYLLLSADFLAVVQVLVYIGAIVVLLMFALMLTHRVMAENLSQTVGQWWIALFAATAIFVVLYRIFVTHPWALAPAPQGPTTGIVGRELLTTYLLPFELASVVLLVAMVGAIILAKEDKPDGSD
ncbi:MAG: NADH-quinone oxidoreductase subunit J family protein [Armatimonadota bacterium]